jgi:hypothetical protein
MFIKPTGRYRTTWRPDPAIEDFQRVEMLIADINWFSGV